MNILIFIPIEWSLWKEQVLNQLMLNYWCIFTIFLHILLTIIYKIKTSPHIVTLNFLTNLIAVISL